MPHLMLALALAAPASEAWPGFRGDGSSATPARLPLRWGTAENVAFRTPLPGYGQSSPAVAGGRAFVTAVDGPEKGRLIVAAVDARSGRVAWTRDFASTLPGKNNPMMSRAAPTPCADAERVVAFFESGDVVALSHAGKTLWQRSLSREYGELKNNHGLGASPAQSDAAVFVLADHQGPSYLAALDKRTGKTLWKADRASRSSWTSPVVAELGGREAVVVSSGGTLDAYDAATGALVARAEGLTGNTIPSPAVAGGRVITGAGESRVKPDLLASALSNACFRLDGSAFAPVWRGAKAISHHASPVAHAGHVYFTTKTGFVHCLDAESGEERYAERLPNVCWATPVAAGDRVYFFGKDGVTAVLKAGPTYELLATNRLWGADDFARRREEARAKAAAEQPKPPAGRAAGGDADAARLSAVGDVVYGVAAADGTIFLRTGTELIGLREGGAQ